MGPTKLADNVGNELLAGLANFKAHHRHPISPLAPSPYLRPARSMRILRGMWGTCTVGLVYHARIIDHMYTNNIYLYTTTPRPPHLEFSPFPPKKVRSAQMRNALDEGGKMMGFLGTFYTG